MNSFETRDNIEELERQYKYIDLLKNIVSHISEEKNRQLTAFVETFGCQMNARDSEKISGILKSAGFTVIEDENADLTIYNTCSVRDNANQKVYGRLGRLSTFKKQNPDMKVVLCGCMTQEECVIEKLCTSYGFVDLIFGTHNIYRFAEYLFYVYES